MNTFSTRVIHECYRCRCTLSESDRSGPQSGLCVCMYLPPLPPSSFLLVLLILDELYETIERETCQATARFLKQSKDIVSEHS